MSASGASTASPFFKSFWHGGFEGSDHVNGSGTPLCMNSSTRHCEFAREDYERGASQGLRTVRESVGWRQAETAWGYDFSSVQRRMEAAQETGVQVLWTCFHFGLPPGLDLFSDQLAPRLSAYCAALADFLKPWYADGPPPIYTPINEISFLCWAACETGLMHPHRGDRAGESQALKRNLARAAICAADAIRAVDPRARILAIDPLIHVAPGPGAPDDEADRQNAFQFQAWDMLCGRSDPDLGGGPAQLDLVGANYYPHNQWQAHTRRWLQWPHDPARRPLADLLVELSARYAKPVVITETGHVEDQRGPWIQDVGAQVRSALDRGANVAGICLYPLLDRPDWEAPEQWHRSGLWLIDADNHERRLEHDYASALARGCRLIESVPIEAVPAPAPSPNSSHRNSSRGRPMDTIIVFSHLRWDFVYQRPQHVLSRLAAHWRIVFVEEPDLGDVGLGVTSPAENVHVLRPRSPMGGAGFNDASFPDITRLLLDWCRAESIERYGAWLYTPMALPLLADLAPETIVYDCMDELSLFRNAPAQLLARETTLLKIAGVIFTGGPSLFDAKRDRHPEVHCLPSSVDAGHFGAARDAALAHEAYADLPHPRLGFYGVIDERLDIGLIEALAQAEPSWQICLVGPVVKIDPASLPRRDNIHYLGQQSYAALPSVLAAWDVCLLPFALNEATRFISPTKTLEYFCAERPVVSTDIADVRRLYGEGVAIATDTDAFIDACRAALLESDAQASRRCAIQRELVAGTSWDATAARMHDAIQGTLDAGLGQPARDFLAQRQVVALPLKPAGRTPQVQDVPCLILGAGPTGLSAAYHFGKGSLTIDANDRVGGWCRSFEDKGFVFDYAGHIMFSKDPYVLSLYTKLLGDNLHWQDREAWIYSKGVHTRYPFQSALHGLPVDVLNECIVGAIEARFGPLDGDAPAPRRTGGEDCCADGTVTLESASGDVKDLGHDTLHAVGRWGAPRNFEEFIYQTWGAGVARHFAVPYNQKLWTIPLKEMETSWLGGRVPLPSLEEMIDGGLRPVAKPVGPNARFGYPLKGGFQALMDGFLPHLTGELRLSTRIVALSPATRTARLDDGSSVRYGTLVSTIPLPDLVRMIDDVPASVVAAAAGLRHVSVRCVNLGVARAGITDKHWIYYPEDTVFHRIFVQGNASPENNPEGGFGLTCEITYSPTKPLPCDGDELIARCVEECRRVGMLHEDDTLVTANVVDMPYAYVTYDHARADNVARIRTWLATKGIVLAGRYSEWEYYNSDHAFIAGKRAAESVLVEQGAQRA